MAPLRRVVVVGASLAGLRAAEALRKNGYVDELVIVGDEPHMPYNRPPLSKPPVGEPEATEWLRPHKNLADAEWRLGQKAVSADVAARTVTLSGGDVLSWAGLVIATGLRPRRLPLPGPVSGRHVVRNLDDAVALRRATAVASAMVVVGAGFIGCEVAAAAAQQGITTHVVAPESVPIERPLGPVVGAQVRRRLEAIGVQFHLGTVPVELLGDDVLTGVVLSDGTELAADVALEAIGSVPNVEWLAGSGFDLSDGVLCDDNLRPVGRPDVVACGDVARFPDPLAHGSSRRVEHWMTAVDSGRRAGQVLAAHLTAGTGPAGGFDPVLSFWSHQGDLRIQAFGSPGAGDDVQVLEGGLDGDVAVGYHRDGELVGVVLLGLPSRYAHYRKAIETAKAEPVSG